MPYIKTRNGEGSSQGWRWGVHPRDGAYQSPSGWPAARTLRSLSKSCNHQIGVENVGGYITYYQGVLGSTCTRGVTFYIVWISWAAQHDCSHLQCYVRHYILSIFHRNTIASWAVLLLCLGGIMYSVLVVSPKFNPDSILTSCWDVLKLRAAQSFLHNGYPRHTVLPGNFQPAFWSFSLPQVNCLILKMAQEDWVEKEELSI